MLWSWWPRRSKVEDLSSFQEVDEWPALLGQRLASIFAHTAGPLPNGPGVVIITGPNSVGTRRIAPIIDRSGAFVTWLIHANGLPTQVPVEGMLINLKDALQETLPLPHALFVGGDGRIWRRSYVGVPEAWMRFATIAQGAFAQWRNMPGPIAAKPLHRTGSGLRTNSTVGKGGG